MLAKQFKDTLHSQEYSSLSTKNSVPQNYIQVYKIKVDHIPNPSNKTLTERNVYLNVIFSDPNLSVFQSQCANILKDNKFFEIKTRFDIDKIEVLDYESLKKLCKISFKGIKKEFNHCHVEAQSEIQIQIQRIHVGFTGSSPKCKETESIYMEKNLYKKDYDSTDDSESDVSN
jgi:hypothetical protein